MHILKDIKNRGYQLGSTYKQELEKKLRSTINFNSEIIDFNEQLQAENLKYSRREKEFQRFYANIRNKVSQLNSVNTKLTFQITYE